MCGEGSGQLINVGVEDFVYETDRRRLVRIGIWEFDVNFPLTPCEGC